MAVRIPSGRQIHRDPARTLRHLEAAAARKLVVTISYTDEDGADTVRTIEPYEIYEARTTGNTLIRSLCRMRGKVRAFLPESITSYTVHKGMRRVLDHTVYELTAAA